MAVDINGSSTKAVDGSYNTAYRGRDASCSVTSKHRQAWWAVDMRQEYIIMAVTITNNLEYGK